MRVKPLQSTIISSVPLHEKRVMNNFAKISIWLVNVYIVASLSVPSLPEPDRSTCPAVYHADDINLCLNCIIYLLLPTLVWVRASPISVGTFGTVDDAEPDPALVELVTSPPLAPFGFGFCSASFSDSSLCPGEPDSNFAPFSSAD